MEKYQTIFPRICAVLLDSILLLPLAIIEYWVKHQLLETRYILILLFIVGLFNVVYHITMHTLFGQTVGKMLMNIKVFDISESKISFRQAFLRNLPQIILVILFFTFNDPLAAIPEDPTPEQSLNILMNPYSIISTIWYVSDVIFFFVTDKNRALHDFVAGTVVMNVKDEEV